MAEHRGDHRRARALIVTAAAIVAIASAVVASQNVSKAPATVKDIMLTMTVPSSEVIFSAASEPPKDQQQWDAVRKGAGELAESGRLLMSGGRAKDTTTWMEMARDLVKQAEATLKAAEGRNSDALSKASDDVYLTCETCHGRYLTP
jgi:cytochrome c556